MGCISSNDKGVLQIQRFDPSHPEIKDVQEKTQELKDYKELSTNPLLNLQNATYNNTRPFIPTFTSGKCIKVYDGDTFHIAAVVNGDVYRFVARMYGYDSPELRTKNAKEKEAGYKAKAALDKRIGGKTVSVFCHPIKEKFGRLLVTISDGEGEINKWMVENGHGTPYFGGTKEKAYDEEKIILDLIYK